MALKRKSLKFIAKISVSSFTNTPRLGTPAYLTTNVIDLKDDNLNVYGNKEMLS
jgi:hypothetical protein